MSGYTKLFSSIVNSTIWREENHVRLVWITMLALADKNGLVEASVPGLADAARVTIEECNNALLRLSEPDEYSRSQENEGRRIEKDDGGWLLLNYVRYRGKLTQEKIREQNRARQQKFRENKRNVTVTHNGDVTPINAQSESESESESKEETKRQRDRYSNEFEQFWIAYPKKTGKAAAYRKWKTAKRNGLPCVSDLIVILEKHKEQGFWKEGKIYKPENWIGDGHWEDEIENPKQPTIPDINYDTGEI